MKRGYFAIGIYLPKTTENMGTLWRSAHNFGADFIFTIGERYKKQPSDTTKAEKHIPLFHFDKWEEFIDAKPKEAEIIIVEQFENSRNIKNFIHPERAIYVLGAEDKGIQEEIAKGYQKIFIDTPLCLNVAVAGSIVMFDRKNKFPNLPNPLDQ